MKAFFLGLNMCNQDQIFEEILRARLYDVVEETPLEFAPNLSQRLDNRLLLKREDLQPVFSFKIRGAYHKIKHLSAAQRQMGVVAASAGNHAQGVALSCNRLGIQATIVMPVTTPTIKVRAVRAWGAEVVLQGDTYDEAFQFANDYATQHQRVFIHPYNDCEVIAGQGTIAMEIVRQYDGDIHAIFVPVGGGGLIAGIACYIKKLLPSVRIVGVEPDDAASMYHALREGQRITLPRVGIFADGVAVKQIGDKTFALAQNLVDEVLTVSVDEICAAIKDIYEENRSIAEPAGALAVAGAKKYAVDRTISQQTLVAIQSGANISFDRLRHVAERADIGEKKEMVFAATIDEKPGSFNHFCQLLGRRQITEFNYRYAHDQIARVFVGVELGEHEPSQNMLDMLTKQHIAVVDMTDNEMAKQHVRYMVGGHAPQVHDEAVYSFVFPERPGALLDFLSKIGGQWNISLFHYRNHGAAYGRALVGLQIPEAEQPILEEYFDRLGFPYNKEVDNPAYELFLA
jgi:threonine dehydratase